MKKIIVSLAVIATITFSAQGQTRRNNSVQDTAQNENKENHSKTNHKVMAEKLQLTDVQKQQMKSINMDFKHRMKELKNRNLTTEELNTKKEALHARKKTKNDGSFNS